MKSCWNISKLRKGRLVRVVALLFLFHAGVDLLFPQLCSEEPVGVTLREAVPVSKEASSDETTPTVVISLPYDSGDEQPQEDPPPRDEDCFCCCTHVTPSPVFANPESAELKLPTALQDNVLVLSAPPNNLYHPPRFA